MQKKNKNIKYAMMTTVESNMRSFCLPLAEALAREGFDVSVLCAMSDAFVRENKAQFHLIPIGIRRGFHPLNLVKTIIELFRIFRREKFDAVQYATENAAFCGAIAARLAGVPIRIYEHWGARYVGYVGLMRRLSIFIEKTAAAFSTDVRQVSRRNMELCVADGLYKREKVRVLGKGGTVGVDFARFDLARKAQYRRETLEALGIPEEAFVFGFVGRIQSDKGVNELLEAFLRLLQTQPDVYLILVGAPDDANPADERLIERARECGRVKFAGFVSDVYRYISAFDVMVHPTYREGFGMVLQEAAALKVPIVTTDIIGPGEYIINGQTGVLTPARDAAALVEAMSDILLDAAARERYAEANYRYTLENFERSVMIERIVADRKNVIFGCGKNIK